MKYVSVMWKSIAGLAMITPVSPPKRKVTRKPSAQYNGFLNSSFPPHIVPIQLKNFTPVGTEIAIVMIAKNGRKTWPVPYMWWAQTEMDRAAMAIVAKTSVLYPKIGLREKTGRISEMIPKKGSARM